MFNKSVFVGEKNFNIIKMHGTPIKIRYVLATNLRGRESLSGRKTFREILMKCVLGSN
jgi:hypothetical protein